MNAALYYLHFSLCQVLQISSGDQTVSLELIWTNDAVSYSLNGNSTDSIVCEFDWIKQRYFFLFDIIQVFSTTVMSWRLVAHLAWGEMWLGLRVAGAPMSVW